VHPSQSILAPLRRSLERDESSTIAYGEAIELRFVGCARHCMRARAKSRGVRA